MAQAFAAGIDYQPFEDRQQSGVSSSASAAPLQMALKHKRGHYRSPRLLSFLTCHTGDGQDSPLCWLHNSLVCCLNAHSQGIGQFGTADFLHPFYTLGESTEQRERITPEFLARRAIERKPLCAQFHPRCLPRFQAPARRHLLSYSYSFQYRRLAQEKYLIRHRSFMLCDIIGARNHGVPQFNPLIIANTPR